MSHRKTPIFGPGSAIPGEAPSVRVRVGVFQVPSVGDGAVIGRLAPLSLVTMKKTLRLVSPEAFAGINVRDDKIGSILVRKAILRKISWRILTKIVLQDIKPLMTKSEILALHIEIEVGLGENL
jgi:hypothetical protein